jgi:ATP-dependent Clp protease protease subunit
MKNSRKIRGMAMTREEVSDIFSRSVDFRRRTIWLWDSPKGLIDGSTSIKLVKALELMGGSSNKPIRIVLNSCGGFIVHGYAIYDAIKHCPVPVIVEVYGEACSAASIILQAADHRRLHRSALVMIHDGSSQFDGHPRDLEEMARISKLERERMYRIYAERSGKSIEHFAKRCAHDAFYTAAEAVAEGLADEIIEYPKKKLGNNRKNRRR